MTFNYEYPSNFGSFANSDMAIWVVISFFLAIALGIVLYFTFLKKENDGKFKGFLGHLYDFLSFKSLTLEVILKICYLVTASFITLFSLSLLTVNFFAFLFTLIFANLGVRIAYELLLMTIMLCKNVSDINSKLGNKSKKEDK